MLLADIKSTEQEYYGERHEMMLPDILCRYYEDNEFELVYYLSKENMAQFGEAEFYFMLSAYELGYEKQALEVKRKYNGEWFNICKQFDIYWKHVCLYALYFKDFDINDYFQDAFDNYYDDPLIEFYELLVENPNCNIEKSLQYTQLADRYKKLCYLYKRKMAEDAATVVSFSNVQWGIWRKYNSQIKNGGQYDLECVYDQDGLMIYSYKPKMVAASMHIITDHINTIILDCGCQITDKDSIRIPVAEILKHLEIKKIDAVVISHAHMDHYGGLSMLKDENILMTATTKQLIQLSAPEIPLYNVTTVDCYKKIVINGIEITLVPNGHIIGSVMTNIEWENKRIVYTGDFSVEDQHTVSGFRVNDLMDIDSKKIDVLITETTYGKRKGMMSLSEYEKIFVKLCRKQIETGNKIIIPCFAMGRSQEIALILSEMAREIGARILIDGAMASRITDYYQTVMNISILNRNISICRNDLEFREKIMNHDIILASSGMRKEGSISEKYVLQMIEQEKVCVMKVGFIHDDEHMLRSIINRKNNNINFIDIPLSAHAGYDALVNTLDKLSPDCAIYVHGGGIDK